MRYTGAIAGDIFILVCIFCIIVVGYEIFELYQNILTIGD